MSVKVSEIAKIAGISIDEAVEKLRSAGLEIADGDTEVEEEALKIAGLSRPQIDRRQEMVRKALGRRKTSVKMREVVITNDEAAPEPQARQTLSKGDLLRRKQELADSLRKVDEIRKDDMEKRANNLKEAAKAAQREEPVTPAVEQDATKRQETQKPIQEEVATETSVVRDEVKPVLEVDVAEVAPPATDAPAKSDKKETAKKKVEPQKEEVKKPKVKKSPFAAKDKNWQNSLFESMSELKLEDEVESELSTPAPSDQPVAEVETVVEAVVEKPKPPSAVRPTPQQYHKGPHQHHKGVKGRGKKGGRKGGSAAAEKVERPVTRPSKIYIDELVVVSELAHMMGVRAAHVIKSLMNLDIFVTLNQTIDSSTAIILASEYGIEVEERIVTEEDVLPKYEDDPSKLTKRSPIVAVMGHVDHGKTSLLDTIRKTSVADKEAGGITQHIGAYEVKLPVGSITFLDTPGHEAFTALRARGAQITDIVILVVAADDDLMPQTKEAIDHALAAGVRIVVAINKVDKPDANPQRIKQQLSDYGLVPEEWGGEFQFQEISAKFGTNVDDLLERVLLEAEVLELQGDPTRMAEGIVIEAKLDRNRGALATVLIKSGTLRKGDYFVSGNQFGKIRAMFDHKGANIKSASLAMPVEIMGFVDVPNAGERFLVVESDKVARKVLDIRDNQMRKQSMKEKSKLTLTDLFGFIKDGSLKELNIVIKCDVHGSLEALKSSLMKMDNEEVAVNIIRGDVGGINESDVILASASNALLIGFNVRPDANARGVADREGVDISLYSIIYKVIDDVKHALEGLVEPGSKEEIIGHLEIRNIFSIPKIGKIAGSYVTDGIVKRDSLVRVVRDNIVIYDGQLSSLKRFQDDVKEVRNGYECGISIDKYQDIKEGDVLEVYEIVEVRRTFEDVKSSK